MSILNKANKKLKKINATDLKVMGFVCQGWGSPTDRKMYDTRNYELVMPRDWDRTKKHITDYFEVIWFPKTFMGIPYISYHPVDARGCLWISLIYEPGKIRLIPIKTMSSLTDLLEEIQSWVNRCKYDTVIKRWEELPSVVRPFKMAEHKPRRKYGTSK